MRHLFQCNTSICSRISYCPYNSKCTITDKKIYIDDNKYTSNNLFIDLPPGSFSLFVVVVVDDDVTGTDEFDDDVLDDEYDGVPELLA